MGSDPIFPVTIALPEIAAQKNGVRPHFCSACVDTLRAD